MNRSPIPRDTPGSVSFFAAALLGGAIAGTLDLVTAFVSYGWGVPRVIAAGILGKHALQGGDGVWMVGVVLHFLIAITAAELYWVVSRRLRFLLENWAIVGTFYGVAVFIVMNFIILPISALHITGPYPLHMLLQGLLVHIVCIGIPIAAAARYLGGRNVSDLAG